jgi:hypothetical protein
MFEATQGLLRAQQELTRTLLCGRGGQEHGDDRDEATSRRGDMVGNTAPVQAGEVDNEAGEADEVDDERDEGTRSPAGDAL